MKRKNNIVLVVLFLFNHAVFSQIPDQSINDFKNNLIFLGSDVFEGRGTGTLGGYLASKYLAYKFDELNLISSGDDGTYYQNIPFHSAVPLSESQFTVYHQGGSTNLKLWDDYVMIKTGDQTYIPKPEKLVFASYGIIAPEYDYNDYQYIDVENKVVVILEGEPHSDNPEYFDGEYPTVYSSNEAKERIAISRGARGCIFIPNKKDPGFNWNKIKNTYSFEDVRLAYNPSGNFSIILNPEKADLLFDVSPLMYDDVYRQERFGALKSFPLSSKVSFKGVFRQRDFFSPNIVGILQGSDSKLKDEYIIISAHYDHLGIGPAVKGDSVYNGVFDNAMGVAGVLELAALLSKNRSSIKRSIIFLLTTAEEKGLLGSKYYTQNPVIPLYKTIANLNVDGIAAFDEFKSVIGVGAEFSTLGRTLKETAAEKGLKIGDIPPEFNNNEAFNMSDQMSFARAGIPSILILDAPDYVHLSGQEAIDKFIYYDSFVYHTPFDDLSLPVNYKAVKQHLNFLYSFIKHLSDSPTPEWNPGAPFINERLRSIAEKR